MTNKITITIIIIMRPFL